MSQFGAARVGTATPSVMRNVLNFAFTISARQEGQMPRRGESRVGGLDRRARAWNQFPFTVWLKCHDRTQFVAHFGRTRSPFRGRAKRAKSKRTRASEVKRESPRSSK